ncbi:hypothetical protein ACIQW5_26530 [Methylorubrum thiocyanatum]|uniref:hypothetical protein n=1 Tax=Methylorubrum thiocyanatum TaxID=47958 RepID=UPI00383A728D
MNQPTQPPTTAESLGYVPPAGEPCTPAEFEAWSRPWLEMSLRATEASLALRGGRCLTAEEVAAKIKASSEAPLIPFTDL